MLARAESETSRSADLALTAQHEEAGSSSVTQRSCVVCRRAAGLDELLRLSLVGGHVVLLKPGKGRSCYVCVNRKCLEGLDPKQLSRGFKKQVRLDSLDELIEAVGQLAQRRLGETLGLARRQGSLILGVDRVHAELGRPDVGDGHVMALRATDLAERTNRQLERIPRFLAAEAMGALVGVGRVGAVAIPAGEMADRASYWLRVWQESTRNDEQAVDSGRDKAQMTLGQESQARPLIENDDAGN